MAIITKITTQKKAKDRYNIFIDDGKGERYAFSVHEDVLISHNLQKGQEIDEFDIEEISFNDDVTKAFQQSLVYLSYRMRATSEVIQHLKEKEYEDAVIQEVIHKVTNLSYLNDEEFAVAYVNTNAKVSLKGPVVLKQELLQKKMPSRIIEHALSQYSFDHQVQYAKKYCDKTYKKTVTSSERMQKQKITEALIRKGFTQDVITIVLDESVPERDAQEEWVAICNMGEKAHRRYSKFNGWEYSQKMKQYLFQKGFPIDLIEQYLQSEDCPNPTID
ncbi:regulatory protein [Bacillus mesophilus]|uniref:Regulatory protein RecX n=1 Tax=Bacillus mesophilus TaxID=1808955 RepID=A0A6M0QAK4_9BACI|nr:recombination regulator RecX [Bacillus mesophilus]MBM7662587.1 regulatory protein [Bacillus mesophilus]NEY73345.1 recombination regulator RecX [Bacillus mesophilus]